MTVFAKKGYEMARKMRIRKQHTCEWGEQHSNNTNKKSGSVKLKTKVVNTELIM